MTDLEKVKVRINVLYNDPIKDADIQASIDSCRAWIMGGGVSAERLTESPLAVDAYVLWWKMAQSTDPRAMTRHPVLTSIIKQLGGV